MSKRGQSKPWKVNYTWDDGAKGKVAYVTEDAAEMCAARIRNAAECQDRTVEVTVTLYKTAAQQHAELMAVVATFTRDPGSRFWTSPLFPGKNIGVGSSDHNCGGAKAPYSVFDDGDRLVNFRWAYTLEGAVATIVGESR